MSNSISTQTTTTEVRKRPVEFLAGWGKYAGYSLVGSNLASAAHHYYQVAYPASPESNVVWVLKEAFCFAADIPILGSLLIMMQGSSQASLEITAAYGLGAALGTTAAAVQDAVERLISYETKTIVVTNKPVN